MVKSRSWFQLNKIKSIGLSAGIIATCLIFDGNKPKASLANSLMEFRWENIGNYRKLYYSQSSKEKRDRATYYLVMRPTDRKTAILKLTIKMPEHFDARITPKNLTLCKVTIGGMLSKTKCEEKIPAIFEIAKNQSEIEIFPERPIPVNDGYAVVMKIFNPNKAGMFQINAMAQAPGDIPVSGYLGSWNIDIE